MIKIKVSFKTPEEKDKMIQALKNSFQILELRNGKKEGPYKRIYIDLENR